MVQRAWGGELEFGALFEYAAQLESSGQTVLAVVLYQTWLQRTLSPYVHAVHFNLGVALSNLNDSAGAEAAYQRAIALQDTFLQPRLNLGTLYEKRGAIDQALAEWTWIERNISTTDHQSTSLVILALNNLARVHESRKELSEASRLLTRSLTLNPDQPDALHHWVHLRQKQCLWPVYEPFGLVNLDQMQRTTSALAMLSVSDDPGLQLDTARHYVAQKVQSVVERLSPRNGYQHNKIRIGYASSDFSLHPVSMLMVELFELHDRERFEVFGYCWSPEDGSGLRQRVIASMDHFHRINHLDDRSAALLIREHEIDILVDLQGQTAGARANMLAYRPAPVQITYLGLPATTGLPSIDYVIADRFLIPPETAPFYSEKPLYMPDVYQVSDRKREVGPKPTRYNCGLPDDKLVFCSLNNNYKYTPEVFAAWIRILRRVPDSVLWLLSDNPWAEANLRNEFGRHGVDHDRLYFAQRALPPDYLARYQCADLFLDTFPFNAGTTANDALWMGLPVLTLSGRTFASRMAGALLTAAGLPELITYNLNDYEERACRLGNNRGELNTIRERLRTQRDSSALFDTARFTKNLEDRVLALPEINRTAA
jgi:predicted O-linked N-acetylglucosamine transferase (SPINDLY family)